QTQTPFGGQFTQIILRAASVALLPIPRMNALFVAVPRGRVEDVIREIKRLDVPANASQSKLTYFPLKKASAQIVATQLNNFYSIRYPQDTNQTRFSYDTSTNTVIVQAAPADLDEIRAFIERIDNTQPVGANLLRIVPLKYALADELANLLVQSISAGVVT